MLRIHQVNAALLMVMFAVSSSPSAADVRLYHRSAKSGEPTLVHTNYNCSNHSPSLLYRGFFVRHGTGEVRKSTRNRCGNANEPVEELWYTSNPGFVGEDEVIFPSNSGISVISRVIEIDVR